MKKIIIDTDPGVDDALAIILALKSPCFEVDGLTVVSGNVEMNLGVLNSLKTLEICKRTDVGVYKGAEKPLKKQLFDATCCHGSDGLGENHFDNPAIQCRKESAVDFILDHVNAHPHEITLVALGPLTNVATAILQDLSTMKKLKELIIMGGAAKAPGNCSPVAEFNFLVDPDAAKIVFQSGIENITMVGLDVTRSLVMTHDLREVIKTFNTQVSEYIADITKFYIDFHWTRHKMIGCFIDDPLVLALMIDPSIVEMADAYVDIVTKGLAEGQSVTDFNGFWNQGKCNAKVCTKVNPQNFFELYLKTVFSGLGKELDIDQALSQLKYKDCLV